MLNHSIESLLALGQQTLQSSSDSAKLDSQLLLAFVLNKNTTYLTTWPENVVSAEHAQAFIELLTRRAQGEPIAYLLGEKDFWSLTLAVAPATLIPRPDTETLVEIVLANHPADVLSCLDLGTGTGAIALALASENPKWQISAVDFNADAVKLAQKNAKTNQLTQVNIYQSDWFSQVPSSKKFDIIVSNPPYIAADDQHLAQGDVRFEPLSALVAANQGYADLEHIIKTAIEYLKPQAYVYLEHGFMQAAGVQTLFQQYGYQNIHTVKDLSSNDRITYAQYNSNR